MKKLYTLLTLSILLIFSASAERTGDVFEKDIKMNAMEILEVSPCLSATNPEQCAYFDGEGAANFVKDTMIAQGADPSGCEDILVLSSGNPADADTTLSTGMANSGCGKNPDGYNTYDCTELSYSPGVDSVVLAISSEWPEFLSSSFTDWMEIGNIVDISINDWVGDPSLVELASYGPSKSGTVTLSTLSASSTVNLRVADSGDGVLDTAMIVVPLSCFDDDPTTLLCGNQVIDPGEECDDGNQVSGDGCSASCLIEEEDPTNGDIPEFTILGAAAILTIAGLFLIYKRR